MSTVQLDNVRFTHAQSLMHLSVPKLIQNFAVNLYWAVLNNKQPGAGNLNNDAPAKSSMDEGAPARHISRKTQ